jgi:serine/threonine protein kinase
MLWEDRAADYVPYMPFAQWTDLEPMFKDLVLRLTSLDPAKRPTAREALGHQWFEGIEIV